MWYGDIRLFCNLITSKSKHKDAFRFKGRPSSHNITENNKLPNKKEFVVTFDLRFSSCVGHGFFRLLFVELLKGISTLFWSLSMFSSPFEDG
jgi:hypothetical protein